MRNRLELPELGGLLITHRITGKRFNGAPKTF